MSIRFNATHRLALLLLLSTLPLQGCGPLQIRNEETGTWVPFQAGTLELHRDIHIPSERTRTFFQGGVQLPHINEFKPFCQFEVNRLRTEVQTVQADSFAITGVGGKTETVVGITPTLVASLDNNIASLDRSDGGPLRVTQILYFRLHSDRQPDVRELACGGAFDSPGNAYAPTLQEIAAALGKHATLTLR
ncbi:MAG: hypothetical protein KKA36_00250 [Gammaproteobacteria bacterium]|nr:hypothetical protein [Gammaproteobacteria bacterium]